MEGSDAKDCPGDKCVEGLCSNVAIAERLKLKSVDDVDKTTSLIDLSIATR